MAVRVVPSSPTEMDTERTSERTASTIISLVTTDEGSHSDPPVIQTYLNPAMFGRAGMDAAGTAEPEGTRTTVSTPSTSNVTVNPDWATYSPLPFAIVTNPSTQYSLTSLENEPPLMKPVQSSAQTAENSPVESVVTNSPPVISTSMISGIFPSSVVA